MFKIHSDKELLLIFDKIVEIPERLNHLNIVEKKELLIHLKKREEKLFESVMGRYAVENHPAAGTDTHLEYCKLKTSKDGYNFIQLESWIEFISQNINGKSEGLNFNDNIFLNRESELFFSYLFKNWLCKKDIGHHVIHYVYRKLSIKTPINKDESISKLAYFTIKCNQKKFAEYWNHNFKSHHENKLTFDFKTNGNVSFKTFEELSEKSMELNNFKLLEYSSTFNAKG